MLVDRRYNQKYIILNKIKLMAWLQLREAYCCFQQNLEYVKSKLLLLEMRNAKMWNKYSTRKRNSKVLHK